MSRLLHERQSALVLRILRKKARAGKLYSEVHALSSRLFKIAPVGVEIAGPDGKRYAVRDNFAGRTAFKTCAIDQFELKEVKPEKPAR